MSRDEENKKLLQSLKDTVEGLLISQLSNVWNVYGGLNRLCNVIEKIFVCGCRNSNQDGDPDYWIFVQGLTWLQPSLASSPSISSGDEDVSSRSLDSRGRASKWLYNSLESHTLSQKLAWLLSDRDHLRTCYGDNAFLSQEKYGEAALICLKAVEQNQSCLLAEIDPSLYLSSWNFKTFQKTHRRCSSLPETQFTPWHFRRQKTLQTKLSEDGTRWTNDSSYFENEALDIGETSVPTIANQLAESTELHNNITHCSNNGFHELKLWQSLPSIRTCEMSDRNQVRRSSLSLASSRPTAYDHAQTNLSSTAEDKLSLSLLKIDYKGLQADNPLSPIVTPKSSTNATSLQMSNISKKARKVQNDNAVKATVLWDRSGTLKTNKGLLNRTNSGSSDTLNLESKTSDDSASGSSVKPCVRPSELNLSAKTWEHINQSTTVIPRDLKRRKLHSMGSAPEYDSTLRMYKKSFIEDGGNTVLPMSMGFFPRPIEGQSLTSFLSSGQFARPSAELDRENAHFSISEAMIAAIEQVKCNRQLRLAEESGGVGDESDEEINHLKQRIRMRRRQRQKEKQTHIWGTNLLSDGKTDTTTTDQSVTPTSSSPGSSSESISTDDVDDMEVDEVSNLSQLHNMGMSMSMASLYSEADLSKLRPSSEQLSESIVSAEGVALSLLRQFKDKQLPRASDLQWLVSEQDAPQELLPLPKSWPVSPDEAEDCDMNQATPLRGTVEWAPPRPQVIFTLHPAPVRRVLMNKQNSRCAGCGMKVAPQYAHKFRYCEYLGRFFCTGCHTNQLAIIPGRVLFKWDFTRRPVSSFSYRLLDQMMDDPLFRIIDINPSLHQKRLEHIYAFRRQLFYLKGFILACRYADDLQERMQKEHAYMLTEQDVYSMHDLVQVKSGELATRLRDLVVAASQHVAECQLCQARGFMCELCSLQEVIYPWQLKKVVRCSLCGACYHKRCQKPGPCPRCVRLERRKLKQDDT